MQVTAAAQRIARTLNTKTDDGFRLYFDADGHKVTEVYGPEAFGPKQSDYAHAFRTYRHNNGRLHHFTAREVQESIDKAREEDEILAAVDDQIDWYNGR